VNNGSDEFALEIIDNSPTIIYLG